MSEPDASSPHDPIATLRWRAWRHLLWIVPLGFALKLYQGPGGDFVRDKTAAVPYELFWILLFFGLFPSRRATAVVPATVLVVTSILETLQLSRAEILLELRRPFLGQALLGTTFDAWDFPVYIVSCLFGWLYLRRLWSVSVSDA